MILRPFIDSSTSAFYAQWSAENYNIMFDKRGGTGGSDGATATYSQPMPSTIEVSTKPRYDFYGYSVSWSVNDLYYSNGAPSDVTWQFDSAESPEAIWLGKHITVYIAAGEGVQSVYCLSVIIL